MRSSSTPVSPPDHSFWPLWGLMRLFSALQNVPGHPKSSPKLLFVCCNLIADLLMFVHQNTSKIKLLSIQKSQKPLKRSVSDDLPKSRFSIFCSPQIARGHLFDLKRSLRAPFWSTKGAPGPPQSTLRPFLETSARVVVVR